MKSNKAERGFRIVITLLIALFVTGLLLHRICYAGGKSRKNKTKPRYKTEVTEWAQPGEQTYTGSPPAGLRDNVAEAKWSVVSGVSGGKLIVILRNAGLRGDAGRIAGKLLGKDTVGGGHKSAGRAEVSLKCLDGTAGVEDYLGGFVLRQVRRLKK